MLLSPIIDGTVNLPDNPAKVHKDATNKPKAKRVDWNMVSTMVNGKEARFEQSTTKLLFSRNNN